MRYHDWNSRLHEVVDAARLRRFIYGNFDCALFAADCVQAMTGIDYATDLRGYDSKISAYRIVAEYGSLEAMITALLMREPIAVHYAQPGDVVLGTPPLGDGEDGDAIGICLGVKFAAPALLGIQMTPMHKCKLAWRID